MSITPRGPPLTRLPIVGDEHLDTPLKNKEESKASNIGQEKLAEQINNAKDFYSDAKRNRVLLQKNMKELGKLEDKLEKLPQDSQKAKELQDRIINQKVTINWHLTAAKKQLAQVQYAREGLNKRAEKSVAYIEKGEQEALKAIEAPARGIAKQVKSLKSFFRFLTGKPYSQMNAAKIFAIAERLEKGTIGQDKLGVTGQLDQEALMKARAAAGKAIVKYVATLDPLLKVPEYIGNFLQRLDGYLDHGDHTAVVAQLAYLYSTNPNSVDFEVRLKKLKQVDHILVESGIILQSLLKKGS